MEMSYSEGCGANTQTRNSSHKSFEIQFDIQLDFDHTIFDLKPNSVRQLGMRLCALQEGIGLR
jgi:hypothetical protein